MKLRITKHTDVRATNIFGKAVVVKTHYTIDRVVLGIFRLPIEFSTVSPDALIYVKYTSSYYATWFSTKEAAQGVLDDIYKNPDKYLRSK